MDFFLCSSSSDSDWGGEELEEMAVTKRTINQLMNDRRF